jgi:hypothetical protein
MAKVPPIEFDCWPAVVTILHMDQEMLRQESCLKIAAGHAACVALVLPQPHSSISFRAGATHVLHPDIGSLTASLHVLILEMLTISRNKSSDGKEDLVLPNHQWESCRDNLFPYA